MNKTISTTDRNILTFTLSALLISSLVLGIVFTTEDPTDTNQLPSIDVILSKNKTEESPDKADFLAMNNNQGGGESDKPVRPQNKQVGIAADNQGQHLQEQVENIPDSQESKTTALLTANQSDIKVETAPKKPEIEDVRKNNNQQLTREQKLAKLENNISDRIEAYSKRPKIKYISANTKSFEFADYMHRWVKKIERVSNMNYPEEARQRNFVGTLIMSVGINSEGTIKEIKIIESSGFKAIDDAAEHLVQLAGPFEAIPQIQSKVDILYITRTWQFLPGNKLRQN